MASRGNYLKSFSFGVKNCVRQTGILHLISESGEEIRPRDVGATLLCPFVPSRC